MTTMLTCFVFVSLLNSIDSAGRIGMNLEQKTYYAVGLSWKNRFMMAQPFVSGNATASKDGRPIDVDSNGYAKSLLPGQYVHTLLLETYDKYMGTNMNHYQTPGLHVFTYTGDCSGCIFKQNAEIVNKTQEGKWMVNISLGTAAVMFDITSIDPANYPQDLALVPIEWADDYLDDIWDPYWITPLNVTGFSVLRYMDFLQTNDSPNKEWSTRILPTNFTQASKFGVTWELIIALSNKLNISPWINIPHLADDEYITNLAKLWLSNYKNTDKMIYVEYSNECWNYNFACNYYAQQQAALLNISWPEWYGQQVCRIRNLFRNVFAENTDKMVYSVLGTQIGNIYLTNKELMNGNNECVSGIALTTYYKIYNMTDQEIASSTMTQLFNNIMSDENQNSNIQKYQNIVNVAKNYTGVNGNNIEVIAYEGSWSLVPHNGPYKDQQRQIYNQMVQDPRAGDTVTLNMENWHKTTGGSLVNVFNYIGWSAAGEYGTFGHLGFQDDYNKSNSNGAYKFKAIQNYLTT